MVDHGAITWIGDALDQIHRLHKARSVGVGHPTVTGRLLFESPGDTNPMIPHSVRPLTKDRSETKYGRLRFLGRHVLSGY